MNNKYDDIKWLDRLGRIFFVLAVCSFFGLFDIITYIKNPDGITNDALFSELFHLPDLRTIILAGISARLGYHAKSACEANGYHPVKGKRLMICSIACIIITFTPLSLPFSILGPAAVVDGFHFFFGPAEYVTISEDQYELYAFLGSADNHPDDMDALGYFYNNYDGHAAEAYDEYKVCGYIHNRSAAIWQNASAEFVLVDMDGNDIIVDGKPVVLKTTRDCYFSKMSVVPDKMARFETVTVKAKDLPVQPYNFRLLHIQRGVK